MSLEKNVKKWNFEIIFFSLWTILSGLHQSASDPTISILSGLPDSSNPIQEIIEIQTQAVR